jgi:4'-phosphopantetheinyl transferase
MAVGWETPPESASDTNQWWGPFVSIGTVEVIHVDLSADPEREDTAWRWMAGEERRRLSRFQYPGPRRRFALCRGALRAVLRQELNCKDPELTLKSGEHGKPFALVAGNRASIEFNISHSGDHGLIALSRTGRVGVDVEERRSRNNLYDLAAMVFGSDEREVLSSATAQEPLEVFLRFWTVKEALAKAWGTGLHTNFLSFQAPKEIRRGGRSGVFHCPRLSEAIWWVEDIGNVEIAAAVAYEE